MRICIIAAGAIIIEPKNSALTLPRRVKVHVRCFPHINDHRNAQPAAFNAPLEFL